MNRLLRRLGRLFLCAGLTGCAAEVEHDCVSDPSSIGMCVDLHAHAGGALADWAFVQPSCDGLASEYANGCSRVEFLVGKGVDASHRCVTAWAALPGQALNVGLLGLGGTTPGRPLEIPSGELTPTVTEPMALELFAPLTLRLGQPFVARVSSNYATRMSPDKAVVHVRGAKQGLIVGGEVTPAGVSQQGHWNVDIRGMVGVDAKLVGGPYPLQIALMDEAGGIGPLIDWPLEIVGDPPHACPGVADCTLRSCGPDPLCGTSCGACAPNEACTHAGQCEPIHSGACPEAADCSGRVCGLDPVCGTSCGGECAVGTVCDAFGQCVSDSATGGTGGMMTGATESSMDSGDATGDDCVPDCRGRNCGLDPRCGVECGTCDADQQCTSGICECAPECGDARCGLDPKCGTHDCGMCPDRMACIEGECVDEHCDPECGERVCGPDPKCGFTCGTCDAGEECVEGSCRCVAECGEVECGLDPVCGSEVCGTCGAGQACQDGQCIDGCEEPCTGTHRECLDEATVRACIDGCWQELSCDGFATCESGVCDCPEPYLQCGARCIDPQTDEQFCGTGPSCDELSECPADDVCLMGRCMAARCEGNLTFDDHEIEDFVRKIAGKPMGELTVNDVSEVTRLCAERDSDSRSLHSATSVRGIECLWNLRELCTNPCDHDDQVERVARLLTLERLHFRSQEGCGPLDLARFRNLNRLETLRIGGIEVENLDFVGQLSGLKELSISELRTPWFPKLDGLTQLTKLRIAESALFDLESLQLPASIVELFLMNNSIASTRGLDDLPNVEELILSGNSLTDIRALRHMTRLRRLTLDDNRLRSLEPLSELFELRKVDADNNEITTLSPLENLPFLESVNADSNAIQSLPALRGGYPALTRLDVSNNQLQFISGLEHGFGSLQSVDFRHNEISDISPLLSDHLPVELVDIYGNPRVRCDGSDFAALKQLIEVERDGTLWSDCD